MGELSTFYNNVLVQYRDLSTLNKCIIGIPCTYVFLKTSYSVLKPLLTSVFTAIGAKRIGPEDAKFDPKKIYLHIFPRKMAKQVPSLSPFVVKVETWLRMTGTEYEVVETTTMSKSTGQIPYIYHDGQEIADSNFIIEYLEGILEMDAYEGLNQQPVGASRAITHLVDESFAFTYCMHRYVYDIHNFTRYCRYYELPNFIQKYVTKWLRGVALDLLKKRGIGRKTQAEVYHIGEKDIRAISQYLGNQQFLMGDKMTKADCAVFGHLCQIVFVDYHYPFMDFIIEKCPNILPYMERIKAKCWPDWDTVVPAGHFD